MVWIEIEEQYGSRFVGYVKQVKVRDQERYNERRKMDMMGSSYRKRVDPPQDEGMNDLVDSLQDSSRLWIIKERLVLRENKVGRLRLNLQGVTLDSQRQGQHQTTKNICSYSMVQVGYVRVYEVHVSALGIARYALYFYRSRKHELGFQDSSNKTIGFHMIYEDHT